MDLSTPPLKKAFLRSLVASVSVSAALGIFAILSGEFGWLELRIVLTTATIAVASIAGLACGAYLATGTGRLLPRAGIGLALLGAVMVIGGIWPEIGAEGYWKLTVVVCVFAIACAHLSLLSMARLAEWFAWSLLAAHVVIFGVAALISGIILFESDSEGVFRLLGVAAIVDAALTVIVPVFHRLSRGEQRSTASIDAEIARLRARIAELEAEKARA